jgi:hypothetical protein
MQSKRLVPALETRLRDHYRREHLRDLIPDDPKKEIPGGDWIQLLGAAYDRKIYEFAIETRPEQDNALIADFNQRANVSHFDLFFNNCANFCRRGAELLLPSLHPP